MVVWKNLGEEGRDGERDGKLGKEEAQTHLRVSYMTSWRTTDETCALKE
jgi:hypothetical protein